MKDATQMNITDFFCIVIWPTKIDCLVESSPLTFQRSFFLYIILGFKICNTEYYGVLCSASSMRGLELDI